MMPRRTADRSSLYYFRLALYARQQQERKADAMSNRMRYEIEELSDFEQVTVIVGSAEVKIRVTDLNELEVDVSAPGPLDRSVFRLDEDGDAPVRFSVNGKHALGVRLKASGVPAHAPEA